MWADAICAHDEVLLSGGAVGILNRSGVESAIARSYHGYYPRIHRVSNKKRRLGPQHRFQSRLCRRQQADGCLPV